MTWRLVDGNPPSASRTNERRNMTKTAGMKIKLFMVAVALALAGVTAGMAANDVDAIYRDHCKESPGMFGHSGECP
jgi:hypothetical protein